MKDNKELERGTYLGGYDASSIRGKNQYKSKLTLFLELTGQLPRNVEPNLAMEIGLILEPFVLEKAEAMLGTKITNRQDFIQHPVYPFIAGHIDGLCEINGEKILIDAKTTSAYNNKQWNPETEDMPDMVLYQLCHYMLCLPDVDAAIAVALIGNSKIVTVRVDRHNEFLQGLLNDEVRFWNENVQKLIPPAIEDISASDLDTLKQIYPQSVENGIDLDTEAVGYANRMLAIKEQIKTLKAEEEDIQARFEFLLATNDTATGGGIKVTWKTQNATTDCRKALKEKYPEIYNELSPKTTNRVFRISKIKE